MLAQAMLHQGILTRLLQPSVFAPVNCREFLGEPDSIAPSSRRRGPVGEVAHGPTAREPDDVAVGEVSKRDRPSGRVGVVGAAGEYDWCV